MLGVVFSAIGAFFVEVSNSIGKFEVEKKEETPYLIPFLNIKFSVLVFLVITLVKPSLFVFNIASLPFFLSRFFLEILVAYFMVKSLVTNERSTASFVLTLTVPLLLLADVVLGYGISPYQIGGIVLIVLVLVSIFTNRNMNRTGIHYSILAAVTAVFTVTLYKYDITHFNSVVAEQLLMQALLFLFFFAVVWKSTGKSPFLFYGKRILFFQSLAHGAGNIVESFAYLFAPPSVVIATKRAAAVFWAILSGNHYFHERHVVLKLFVFLFLAAGVFLLAF